MIRFSDDCVKRNDISSPYLQKSFYSVRVIDRHDEGLQAKISSHNNYTMKLCTMVLLENV
jgi:hypothetical protein